MTRRGFRATVEERPTSAWVLVTVASAMLWITEQLQAWVIVVQVAALLLSLARRTKPWKWQASPIALNIGMFGIAGTTIMLALDGNPATVSLAHFASLSQGPDPSSSHEWFKPSVWPSSWPNTCSAAFTLPSNRQSAPSLTMMSASRATFALPFPLSFGTV